MKSRITTALAVLSIAALAACSSQSTTSLPSAPNGAPLATQSNTYASCGQAAPGQARCFSLVRTDVGGGDPNGFHGTFIASNVTPMRRPTPRPSSTPGPTPTPAPTSTPAPTPTPAPGNPSGYGPSDLHAAYNLPGLVAGDTTGSGQTIGIVDAYNAATAESDLGVYRAQYGLPPCTTANGCFRKVNQTGGTTMPANNASWGQETSLDLDMVSAICPNCHILLVEGNSASTTDLAAAVDTAVALGANAVSNSYGISESATSVANDSHYNHPGVAITASTGDSGYGTQSPASGANVVAVGGTHLTNSGGTWSETAWSSAGSGCSSYNAQPAWQTGVVAGCTKRGEGDVSAVGDPNTGVAVYDSTPYLGSSGWMVFGGTSVASPVVASVFGLAANSATIMSPASNASYVYAHASGNLFDVLSGSNGSCGTAVCNARAGWDGPTGMGSPRGLAAF